MKMQSVVLIGLMAASGVVCGALPAQASDFTASGYRSEVFEFSLLFGDVKSQAFLGGAWRLANFRLDRGEFERREGFYENVDLVLEHREHNGVLFAKSFRLAEFREDKKLDVMFRNIAESLASSGLFVDANPHRVRVTQRSYATFIREAGARTVAGQQAYGGTIEVANTAQLQLDPKHRDSYLQLVLLRVPVRPDERGRGKDDESDVGLILVGYYNTPDYFATGTQEFQAFLGNLRAGGAERQMKANEIQKAKSNGVVRFDAKVDGHATEVATRLRFELAKDTGKRFAVSSTRGDFIGTLTAFNGRRLVIDTPDGTEAFQFSEVTKLLLLE